MRQTLGAIIAVSLLGAGCASSLQETRMYNGPFGRTEVGAVMIAADPASSKVLVETYDGDLWIYDVDPAARGRLSTLRVGDEIILAFDDRLAGKRAIAINVVAPGRRPLPPGILTVADMLPSGVVFGARAVSPAHAGTGAVAVAGGLPVYSPGMIVVGSNGAVFSAANGTIVSPNGVVFGANGTMVGTLGPGGAIFSPNGTALGTLGPNGTMVGTNGTVTGTLGPNGTIVGTGTSPSTNGTFGNANGTMVDSSGNVVNANGAIVGALGANGTIVGANGAIVGTLAPNGGVIVADSAFTGTSGAAALGTNSTNLTNRTTVDPNGNVVAADGSLLGTLGPNRTVVGTNGQVLGTLGTNGTVIGNNGVAIGANPTVLSFNGSIGSLGPEGNNVTFGNTAGGVIVPGFGSFSNLSSGLVSPQTAANLGLTTGAFITSPLAPAGGPSVGTATGVPAPGRSAITSGNFTPGTIAPGVTTTNVNAPGSPVVSGPFTPGTLAPGVSQQRGTAPPAAAGATTSSITHSTPAALQGPVPPSGTINGPGASSTGQPAANSGGRPAGQPAMQGGSAQPATGQPGQPATGQPVTGQPASGQPAAGQPAAGPQGGTGPGKPATPHR
jgi:hypothetical protein